MAKFGEALADVYQKPEATTGNNETEKKTEKSARKRLRVKHNISERPTSTCSGFLIGKKELCSLISDVFKQTFKDYVGCNYWITPEGYQKLVVMFGPNVVNEGAPYRAFTPNIREGKASSIKAAYDAHSRKFSAYTATQEGIDMLSDLVFAGSNQKDSEGRVKNFNQYWEEYSSCTTNGYNVMYPQRAEVFAKMELDIDKVLRVVWPKENNSDQYQYTVAFTNYRKQNDYSNNLLSIMEVSRDGAENVLDFLGIITKSVNIGANCELY